MTKVIPIIALLFFQSVTKISACDCNYYGSFLKMTNFSALVAYVKVTKYLTFKNIYDTKVPMSMEVEIIEVYKGKESRKTVIVWGDIGNLCRPYLSVFKEGQYYIMAFYSGNYGGRHPDEKDSDYAIGNCGAYWLTADKDKGTVSGDIDSINRLHTTVSLPEFKEKLSRNKQSLE